LFVLLLLDGFIRGVPPRLQIGPTPKSPPWRGLYPKASLFIFACGRIFSPKTIRPGGDFVRRLLGYFRLRPEFQSENHPPWRGLYPKAPCLFSPAAGISTGKRTDEPK
jgi:hypothetical protein